jgi:hypothetical protein
MWIDIIIWASIPLSIIGVFVFIIIDQLRYNIIVRIKILTGTKILIHDTKAREFRSEGEDKYKLKKFKEQTTMPKPSNPDVITPNHKGKKCLTVYWDGNEFRYGLDKTTVTDIRDKHIKELGTYDVLTAYDKNWYSNEHKNSLKYGANNFWTKYGTPVIMGSFLIVFLIIVATTYGEFTKPTIENTQKQIEIVQLQKEAGQYWLNGTRILYEMIGEEMNIPSKTPTGSP